ncbi:MAG: hypothetical protein ABH805_02410 [Candidatus Nealsonbacteria bacterium]
MIPDLIFQTIALFVFCFILAAMETQIEGESGWAEKLPTWRAKTTTWYARVYRKIVPGKDITAYHMFIGSLVLFFLHYPYFVSQNWSLSSELTTLSLFFMVIVVWDFLWFVINPKYDFGHFWSEQVWWHKTWFLHFPLDYWMGFLVSALLYLKFSLNSALLIEWLSIVGLMLLLTLVVVILANFAGVFRIKAK